VWVIISSVQVQSSDCISVFCVWSVGQSAYDVGCCAFRCAWRSVGSHAFWRFVLYYASSVVVLPQLVGVHVADRLADAGSFLTLPPCCLDSHFARKVKAAFDDGVAAALCNHTSLCSLLSEWSRLCKLCNVHGDSVQVMEGRRAARSGC